MFFDSRIGRLTRDLRAGCSAVNLNWAPASRLQALFDKAQGRKIADAIVTRREEKPFDDIDSFCAWAATQTGLSQLVKFAEGKLATCSVLNTIFELP